MRTSDIEYHNRSPSIENRTVAPDISIAYDARLSARGEGLPFALPQEMLNHSDQQIDDDRNVHIVIPLTLYVFRHQF